MQPAKENLQSMDYVMILSVFGGVVLLTAWLPLVLKDLPLSLPMVCIAIGAFIVWADLSQVIAINPLESRQLTQRFTEFVVIGSLMGAGLKLDRPIGWRRG